MHGVSAGQRAAAQGVPLQAYPVPQEALGPQEGRQLCEYLTPAAPSGVRVWRSRCGSSWAARTKYLSAASYLKQGCHAK